MDYRERSAVDRRKKGPLSLHNHNDLVLKLNYILGRYQAIARYEAKIAQERREVMRALEGCLALLDEKAA